LLKCINFISFEDANEDVQSYPIGLEQLS